MGFFSNLKQNHNRSLGQAEAIWELKTVANIDMTNAPEADLFEISQPIVEFLNANHPNWTKEDFALIFIIKCGSMFVESKVTTKLFYDAALSYIRSNRLKISPYTLSSCAHTLNEWNQSQRIQP